jgi:hypothetical protein
MARTRPSVRVVVDANAFVSAARKESLWPRPGRDLLFLGPVFPRMVDDAAQLESVPRHRLTCRVP